MGCFKVTELNSGVKFSFELIFKMAAGRHIGLPRYLGVFSQNRENQTYATLFIF